MRVHGLDDTPLEGVANLVLIGRWAYYAEGEGTGRDAHNKIVLSAAPGSDLSGTTQALLYASALTTTINTLGQHFNHIYVMRDVPEIPYYDSREFARKLAHGHMTPTEAAPLLEINRSAVENRVATAEAPLLSLVGQGMITLVDPWPILCPDSCTVMHGGHSWYFDNNHITNTGAQALRELFAPVFRH